ncbi:MAG: MerR family DNA-binding transcriptional regulator [Actinomycetota bacterium]|nr:MerR family DNA-binding transcriptional regulator [Actinomycetota bacterium]
MTQRDSLRIGKLADAAGVSVETVRFYERRSLVPSPPRTPSGYRQFPPHGGAVFLRPTRAPHPRVGIGFPLARARTNHAWPSCSRSP